MNKLRFLWGRMSKEAREVWVGMSAVVFCIGGSFAVGLLTDSAVAVFAWIFGWPVAALAVLIAVWIRTQLTDYEDEPQKPGVEPDPWGES